MSCLNDAAVLGARQATSIDSFESVAFRDIDKRRSRIDGGDFNAFTVLLRPVIRFYDPLMN